VAEVTVAMLSSFLSLPSIYQPGLEICVMDLKKDPTPSVWQSDRDKEVSHDTRLARTGRSQGSIVHRTVVNSDPTPQYATLGGAFATDDVRPRYAVAHGNRWPMVGCAISGVAPG